MIKAIIGLHTGHTAVLLNLFQKIQKHTKPTTGHRLIIGQGTITDLKNAGVKTLSPSIELITT